MPYETIEVRKLTRPSARKSPASISAGPLSNRQVSELHDALMAHQVIFFRDQQMSVDQHKAFGRLFGELLIHPAARAEVEGHPEIRVVHADEKTEGGDRRGLALRHVVRARAADGLDPLPAPDAAGRRRHGLRQHVSRLRDAVGADQAPGRGTDARSTPAPTSIRAAPTSAATRNSPRRCIPSCAPIR